MSKCSLQANRQLRWCFTFFHRHLLTLCLVLIGMTAQLVAAGPPPRYGDDSKNVSPEQNHTPEQAQAAEKVQAEDQTLEQAQAQSDVLADVKAKVQALLDEMEQKPAYQARPLLDVINVNEKNQKLKPEDIDAIKQKEFTQILKEDYLAHGNRNDKWDGPLLKAIDETLRLSRIASSGPERNALVHMLRLPARYKCDDPRYYYMFVYARSYEATAENLQALEKGIELAQVKEEQHRHLIWLLSLRLSQMQKKWTNKQALAIASRQQARDMFVQWLEHDLPKYDENLIYDWADYFEELIAPVVVNAQAEKSIEQMMEKIGKIEHLSPWIQAFLIAKGAREWAWTIRGHEYAHKVSDEAWKTWGEKNDLAYRMAVKAHDLNPQQALAATQLISICWSMDENDGERFTSRYWFEQAVAAMIDYDSAYRVYAIGLMPRWHGSLEMEMDFAWECAQTKRYDTSIPYMAMYVLSRLCQDLQDEEAPIDHQAALSLNQVLEHVMSGYLQKEKQPFARKLMQQFWLNWTQRLDLPKEAVKVNGLLDSPYDSQLPFNKTFFLSTLAPYELSTLLARGQADGELLTRAINTEKYEDNWLAAKRLFQKLLDANEASPEGLQYARDRIQTHQWQEAFDAGQWVPLKFDEHLTGWKKLAGQWARIDENTIQGTNNDLPMRIAPIINLGSGYEWEMTIEFIHKAKGPALMGGIVYAHEHHPEFYNQYGHFVRHEPGSLWAHLGGYEPYRIGNTQIPAKVTCTFIFKDKRMQTLIKDGEVLKDTWMKQGYSHRLLSMGTAFSKNPGSVIQFSNVQVRKIPTQVKEQPQEDKQKEDDES